MEINLRIPDDYCQGYYPYPDTFEDEEYEEEFKVKRLRSAVKLTPRNGLTRSR